MKQKFIFWIEEYLFNPNLLQQLISVLLLPFTLLYMLVIISKRVMAKPINYGLPIVSIGNLVVGGSGKTPMVIYLAKDKKNVCVILRGYGRTSKGLKVISNNGEIFEDVSISGDEAMLIARSLPNATVIVSENRHNAILKAKELGCKIIFLDDGFSKYNILKFDILLKPKKEPTNLFCLPSGGYREPKMMYGEANLVLQEGVDFKRVVSYKYQNQVVSVLPNNLVLLTAISKAKRLLEFLPSYVVLIAYEDHHIFSQNDIDEIKNNYPEYSVITTSKDLVKLEKFNLDDLYLMDLSLQIEESSKLYDVEKYISSF